MLRGHLAGLRDDMVVLIGGHSVDPATQAGQTAALQCDT